MDEDKAEIGKSQSDQQKKNKLSNSAENPQEGQIVPRNNASAPLLESEDEDGFPISMSAPQRENEAAPEQTDNVSTEIVQKKNKREVKTTEQDDQLDR